MIEKERKFEFRSVFAPYIENYLQLKLSFGEKIAVPGTLLRLFDRYCIENNVLDTVLTNKLVDDWLASFENEKASTHSSKISVLRCFSRHMNSLGGIVRWEPKNGYTSHGSKYMPYIFSDNEIQKIFMAADSLRENYGRTRFHKIFPVLLRVLYGAGLRVSEALKLKLKHVDLKNGTLTIENAKFGKSRLLPISESLRSVLNDYYCRNSDYIGISEDNYFFPNPFGERYSQRTVYDKFREVLWKSGIPHRGKGKGPRVHDLRHTFAVRALRQLVQSGKDTYVALTAIMVYLGHSRIGSTEYYLRLTANVFPDFLQKSDLVCGTAIPEEVKIDE